MSQGDVFRSPQERADRRPGTLCLAQIELIRQHLFQHGEFGQQGAGGCAQLLDETERIRSGFGQPAPGNAGHGAGKESFALPIHMATDDPGFNLSMQIGMQARHGPDEFRNRLDHNPQAGQIAHGRSQGGGIDTLP